MLRHGGSPRFTGLQEQYFRLSSRHGMDGLGEGFRHSPVREKQNKEKQNAVSTAGLLIGEREETGG